MDDLSPLLRAVQALAGARSAFVLTGAGMSAQSGLPTFRGAGGYWQYHRVEELRLAAGVRSRSGLGLALVQ